MIRPSTLGIAATAMLACLFLTAPANAFNPQPDPPGKTKLNQASHPAAFDVFLPNGQKQRAFMRGNQLILIGMRGGTAPAPDGKYRKGQGSIVVQGGLIVQGGRISSGHDAQKKGLLLPAVQKSK